MTSQKKTTQPQLGKHTLFISDLHLQQEMPAVTQKFERFMQQEAPYADALYILGDFFEVWIGDDDHTDFHRYITQLLKQLVASSVPIYFMHGNRDFLLGSAFAECVGLTLLPDPYLLELYGKRLLLVHGDALCTLDTKHQKYRRIMLNRYFQKILLALPLSMRRKLARWLRRHSQAHHQYAVNDIGDVDPQEVVRVMQQYQADLLFHGHTHRPSVHHLQLTYGEAQRVVMGAWHDNGEYIRLFSDGHYELVSTGA